MSEKFTKSSELLLMNAVAEASTLLRQIAEPRPVGDSVKSAIVRAARRVSHFWPLHPGRAEDIWRQEARMIRAEEMDAIRKAAERRLLYEARDALAKHDEYIARLEAALVVSDENFHRPVLDALRASRRRSDRAVDGE